MPFSITENNSSLKFDIITSPDIRALKKKSKGGIVIEHHVLFNNYLMSIWKKTRELYIFSQYSYPKYVVIMISIDNIISLNEKVIKIIERELTFGVIK